MDDRTRQALVAAALIATLTMNGLANGLPLNGQTTGEISNRFPLAITPAGYVFSIWGLIYLGLIGYVVYQALPGQAGSLRLRRIGLLFIASCAANMLWLLLWHFNRYQATMAAMAALLFCLILIAARLDEQPPASRSEGLLVDLPFNIYLGWISVATIVNATVVLYDAGWDGLGLDPQLWTSALLGVGATLAGGQALLRKDAAFPLVIAWAFTGIARKPGNQPPVTSTAWAAAALAGLAGAAVLIHRMTANRALRKP